MYDLRVLVIIVIYSDICWSQMVLLCCVVLLLSGYSYRAERSDL